MKECPVCKEHFGDELYFCDLDGTPLDGTTDSAAHSGSSRLWSTLGVVLLLGAVVISAVAIIFFPRGFSPSVSVSKAQTADSTSGRGPVTVSAGVPGQTDQSGANAVLDPTADGGTLDNSNSAKLDRNANSANAAKLAAKRAQLLQNQNGDPSLPNPKTAFAPEPDSTTAVPKDASEQNRPRVTTAVEPVATDAQAKSAAAKSADASEKSDQQSAQLSKNARKKTTKSADPSDKTDNANKKKGGLLKMFKKIFG
jgi:hypothetical protein